MTPIASQNDAEAVQYEIMMLEFDMSVLSKKVGITIEPRENSEKIYYAVLESFLIHCRNLRDFLVLNKPKYGDDIIGVHFLEVDPKSWDEKRFKMINLESKDTSDKLNKMLAHISNQRTYLIEQEKGKWDKYNLYNEIIDGLTAFRELLPDERKSWFNIPDKIIVNNQNSIVCDSTSSYETLSIVYPPQKYRPEEDKK